MKILHIITSLDTGGAQMVLFQLAQQLNLRGDQQRVISLKSGRELADKFIKLGIPVIELDASPIKILSAIRKCNQLLKTFQPDVIQSWLYHADFFTALLNNRLKTPIVWGIHHTYESQAANRLKVSTRIIVKVNSMLSKRVPKKIICCSRSALASHERIGYDRSKLITIANGVDPQLFKPASETRSRFRNELGLLPDTLLLGYIARLHPQKDHGTFFKAASLLLKQIPDVHFVLAGNGITSENPGRSRIFANQNDFSHFHLLGRREDIASVTAALDVATLTSSGDEAFPLTILEAMASGVPCVSTDVGDAREMIGSDGNIVPVSSPAGLCQAWVSLLRKSPQERTALGKQARERVLKNYTNEMMTLHYIDVYNSVNG
jgi:glycosyltransferase involved in cell wall biosynthesis